MSGRMQKTPNVVIANTPFHFRTLCYVVGCITLALYAMGLPEDSIEYICMYL